MRSACEVFEIVLLRSESVRVTREERRGAELTLDQTPWTWVLNCGHQWPFGSKQYLRLEVRLP
jgi:hypothetical protein